MPENIQQTVLWLIPVAPLLAAIATGVFGPLVLRHRSHVPCWIGLAVAMVCAWITLYQLVPAGFHEHDSTPAIASGYQWIDAGGWNVRTDIRADAMSGIMLAMVTTVSFLVSIFAAG